jgi:hypothetical protein
MVGSASAVRAVDRDHGDHQQDHDPRGAERGRHRVREQHAAKIAQNTRRSRG